jgi:hypothetical protein
MTEVSPGNIRLENEFSGEMPIAFTENRYQGEFWYWSARTTGTFSLTYVQKASSFHASGVLSSVLDKENWSGDFNLTSKGAPVILEY